MFSQAHRPLIGPSGEDRTGTASRRKRGCWRKWPADGPKLLWQKKDVGEGYATPAVVGQRIYLLSNKGMDDEFVQALDVKDGAQLWSRRLGKVGPNRGPQYPGARSTPTVEGDALYVLGSAGELACLEAASGAVRWQKNLQDDFNGQPGNWAYSESPLVDGDVLVCTPGGSEATLVALNKNNGEVIWKAALPTADQAAYASAVLAETGGVKQYVQFLQKGLVGIDAKTGELLWRYEKTAEGSPANIPTPIVHDDLVYSGAGRSGGGLVKLKAHDGDVDAEPVYFQGKLPTSIGGAVATRRLLVRHEQPRAGMCEICDRRGPVAKPQRRSRLHLLRRRATLSARRKRRRRAGRSHARRVPRAGAICPARSAQAPKRERRPGPILSWPMVSFICATRARCGATTSRNSGSSARFRAVRLSRWRMGPATLAFAFFGTLNARVRPRAVKIRAESVH